MQRNCAKLKHYTRHSLQLSLKLGAFLGTLNKHEAIRLVNVKPVVFHRWLHGKTAAPVKQLEIINQRAIAGVNKPYSRRMQPCRQIEYEEDRLNASFLWRNMIFDHMNASAKRRFCESLKKRYR